MKCKWRGVNHHRTTDQASSGAAQALAVGKFPSEYGAVCNCMASNGKMKPEDCDGLCVYDADNAEVARFTGKQFRAHQGEDGLIVFAMPTAQANHTDNDSIGSVISAAKTGLRMGEKVAHGGVPGVTDVPTHDMRNRLAEINQKNQSFWAKRVQE